MAALRQRMESTLLLAHTGRRGGGPDRAQLRAAPPKARGGSAARVATGWPGRRGTGGRRPTAGVRAPSQHQPVTGRTGVGDAPPSAPGTVARGPHRPAAPPAVARLVGGLAWPPPVLAAVALLLAWDGSPALGTAPAWAAAAFASLLPPPWSGAAGGQAGAATTTSAFAGSGPGSGSWPRSWPGRCWRGSPPRRAGRLLAPVAAGAAGGHAVVEALGPRRDRGRCRHRAAARFGDGAAGRLAPDVGCAVGPVQPATAWARRRGSSAMAPPARRSSTGQALRQALDEAEGRGGAPRVAVSRLGNRAVGISWPTSAGKLAVPMPATPGPSQRCRGVVVASLMGAVSARR
jgi:hypothetical protein